MEIDTHSIKFFYKWIIFKHQTKFIKYDFNIFKDNFFIFMDDLISTTMPRTKQIVHEKLGYPFPPRQFINLKKKKEKKKEV